MKKAKYLVTLTTACIVFVFFSSAQKQLSMPSAAQLAWHEMEFYLFVHFGPNTFTEKEWGEGNESESTFNPTQLDCRQWCRIAKAAGAKGIIITAKHHDGFCLWPSRFSTHTVRESAWENGKGDVLKNLSVACKEYGLKFGVYLSPWDRNHPDYGTVKYNDVFAAMLKEIFISYGPIWELWWDGANGEGPNGKRQVYDWNLFKQTVKINAPQTVVFSDVGPHIRWVGNERGIAGETNWNMLDTVGFMPGVGAPAVDTLNAGNENGKVWIPAECDVSIRPGWFYHSREDSLVKKPDELFDLYLKSVGRGANLLLNVPPDMTGRIPVQDSAALMGFEKIRTSSFSNNLIKKATAYLIARNIVMLGQRLFDNSCNTDVEIKKPLSETLTFRFRKAEKINCIVIKEAIMYGQSVAKFYIEARTGMGLKKIYASTIGRKKIVTFPSIEINDFSIHFTNTKGVVRIADVEAYLIDAKYIMK